MSAITTASTIEEWVELAHAEGLTDGLPVYPPTRAAVDALVESSGRGPGQLLGAIPPRGGAATVEVVAANAAMASCKPDHFEVVLKAVEAMLEDRFNLRGVVTTTHPCWPLVIVSGPVVEQLDMAHTESVFSGGGAHANAAIGRAIKLLLWNAGGATPGEPVKEVFGHPGRYSFCVAESPASPWPPLHQARGIEAESGITVFACESPTSVAMWGADDTPVNRLAQLADSMAIKGCNNTHTMGETLVVLTPNEARHLAENGYDRAAVQEQLWQQARRRIGDLLSPGVPPYAWWPDWVDTENPDELVPVTERPQDIHVMVTGAESIPWMAVCAGWGNLGGYAVSRALDQHIWQD
ncbi:MAG: hypothetical protein F4Z02_09810 [Acidimicrobiia bacterium]|nr:hypothetical protein [Acidimicrobiia bacterium]MYG70956.1 hypothetical protein [Acidimicrobiia bacterium]